MPFSSSRRRTRSTFIDNQLRNVQFVLTGALHPPLASQLLPRGIAKAAGVQKVLVVGGARERVDFAMLWPFTLQFRIVRKCFRSSHGKKEIISDAPSDLNIFIDFDPFWDDAC
jgi:hypothetical protein